MTSLKDKTISSLLWKFLERGGSSVASLAIQIIMARLLTPDDFGALAIMLVFVNISMVFVQSGLNTALIQADRTDKDDFSTVFWLSFVIAGALYLVIFFAAPLIANFYNSPTILYPLRVLMLILFLNAFNAVQIAKVTRDLELKKTFLATIICTIGSGIAGIAAALCGAGIWALVIQQLTYQGINCLVLAFQVDWLPSLAFKISRAKKLFAYSWKLLVSGLLDTAYTSLTSLIIGKFSKVDLGYVSQGEKYPQALGSLLDGTIQPVMLSAISRVQDDIASVKEITRRAIKTSSFMVAPAMGVLALLSEPLIELLLGNQWLPAAPFMQMFCFIYALHPIHTSNLQAINGIGRSDIFLKLELVKKTCGIAIMCFAAFVLKSVMAIVAGMMVAGVLFSLINAWPNKRLIHYSYREQVKDICPAFILSGIAIAIALPLSLLALPIGWLLISQGCIFFAIYFGLAKLLHIETLAYLMDTMHGYFKQDNKA